jgi:hypothetical protein
MTTTTTNATNRPELLETRIREHFAHFPPLTLVDDGVLPDEGWTVWLLRDYPGSDFWAISCSPSAKLRAEGLVDEMTGCQLRTPGDFDTASFNSLRMDEPTEDGKVIPPDFAAAITNFLDFVVCSPDGRGTGLS